MLLLLLWGSLNVLFGGGGYQRSGADADSCYLLSGCCCRAAVADDAKRRMLLWLGCCRAAVGLLPDCCEAVAVDPALEGMLVYRQNPLFRPGPSDWPYPSFNSSVRVRAHRQFVNML